MFKKSEKWKRVVLELSQKLEIIKYLHEGKSATNVTPTV